VAPDHLGTKLVMRTFSELGADPRVRFHLNTEIGRDITVEELREHYHAVFFTHGASSSRRLGIEGEDLPGSHAATQFVAWYNGHPDSPKPRGWQPPSHVVVIGNGNVAIDVARQLTLGPEHLAASDMAPYAVDVLSRGLVKDVTVVGRRSALHAACTLPELEALADRTDIDVVVPPEDLVLTDHELAAVRESGMLRLKYELFRTLSERPHTRERSITFRFLLTPQRILGESHAEGIELARNRMVSLGDRTVLEPTGETTVLPTNLVLRSVGYAGVELPGLPFDEATMTVPTDGARVLTEPGGEVIPGLYSAGWVKRGPSGVMGTNKLDAQGTVKVLLDDVRAGRIAAPAKSLDDLDRLLRQRQPQVVPWQGWQAIEAHELAHGTETGRPRVKVTSREALVEFAAARLSTETEEQ
jgi:ferredoxin--NADP+ reductase